MTIKVVVGISGGVDSSVAALLLKRQGYDVHGVFMQNWEADQNDPYCTAPEDLRDAKKVCEKLDIPLTQVNFSKEYWDRVFQYFLDEYAAGRTPNPDILCNKEIKFKAFLNYALELGADFIATGHYVRKDEKAGKYRLLRGSDSNKDQSYFLYTLTQEQLKYSLFPIGELDKTKVREIAEQEGLITHNKKDSTGICFIGERNFKKFLNEYLLAQPGEIVTEKNKTIGTHDGLMFYTLGQRKGLKIGGLKDMDEKPWYVAFKDIPNNRLIVTQDHDDPLLMSERLYCKDLHWISGEIQTLPYSCAAKIRYRNSDQECVIKATTDSDQYLVEFTEPQWAVTPGQAIVFYQDEICLGGATICQ